MATISQVQNGITKFIDRQLTPSLTGLDKIIIPAGAALIVANLPSFAATMAQKPVVAAMGIYDPEAGTVDVDALYRAVKPHISGTVPIKIPGGITIHAGEQELDTLYQYILES